MESPTLPKPPVRARREAAPPADNLIRPAAGVDGNGHDEHHMDEIPTVESLPRPRRGLLALLGVVVLLVLAVAFVLGLLPKLHAKAALNAEAESRVDAMPTVSLQLPRQSAVSTQLQLPGSIMPLQEASLYARTNGYLKQWFVDYGGNVKSGQLLAVIDAPEVDASLLQARADLASAESNVAKAQLDLTYMETTQQRYDALIKTQSVTPQELDLHRADTAKARTTLAITKAAVLAGQANVKRLEEMQSFEKITAPFAGTITARNFDVGALINASGTSGGQPLFRIAETDVLRVWANVPQAYSTEVKPGLKANVAVREFPGRTFTGEVAHTAGALDPATRTLLTEVRVPNPDGKLLAGMFAQVTFEVTNPAPPLIIPVSALIANAEGNQVAVVGPDNVAHYKPVDIGRDFGTEVEVTSGLGPADRIVTNPGERLSEGAQVRIVSDAAAAAKPTQGF